MKKGQLFILAAFVIAMGIAALANISYFISLPVQQEYIEIGTGGSAIENIDTELIYVTRMDPENTSRIDDFVLLVQNYTLEKNLEGIAVRGAG